MKKGSYEGSPHRPNLHHEICKENHFIASYTDQYVVQNLESR